MTTVKESFDQMMANQNTLVETLSENTQKFMALFEVDPALETLVKETVEANMEQGKEYFNSVLPQEGADVKPAEQMSEAYTKFVEMQTEVYNRNSAFYKDMMEHFKVEKTQEVMKQASDLYTTNLQAIADATSANMKLLQNFWLPKN